MVLHYCGDSELTNGKTIVKNSKLTNGIAFFPQQMQSHKTLVVSLTKENAKKHNVFKQLNEKWTKQLMKTYRKR